MNHSLNNKQLLDVGACSALAHAVPCGVGEDTAEAPGERDGGFSGIWALGLGGHFHHTGCAARCAGGVVADGALGREGRGTGDEAGEHGCVEKGFVL